MNKRINTLYFSATGTTEKVVMGIADHLIDKYGGNNKGQYINFTLPDNRTESVSFFNNDVVVVGVPVYAGRVPNVLLKYLDTIEGNGASAVAVVLYGNRNYDDALIELRDILQTRGFNVIAAGAFIGEHSFSKTLAKERPDEKDMTIVSNFSEQIYKKIANDNASNSIKVKGNVPYGRYYRPKNEKGDPVDIRKVTPKTNNACTDCGICVAVCPMGSIDKEDTSKLNGICIKCGACIKKCPVQAKYYDDSDYLRHQYELEDQFKKRREPELFI